MSQRKFLMDGGFQSNGYSIVESDLQVSGNLVVLGSQTTTTLDVENTSINLNSGATGAPSLNASINATRGDLADVSIRWNETSDQWEFTNDGVNFQALGGGSYNDTLAAAAAGDAGYALETWVNTQIANVIDSAPGALDTLNELAAALGDDANYAGTVTTQLATKADVSYVDAQIAANTTPSWSIVTANTTLAVNTKYVIDTSSTAITLALPTNPSFGDEVRIIDGEGEAVTNNITLTSGDMIQGAADDILISDARAAFAIVYYNAANGWLLTEI